jgi:hypothetical protein
VTGRNIRPISDKPLPVVDFKKEIDALGVEDCPDCDGTGQIDVDCDSCNGTCADDEGNPCANCGAVGILSADCPTCEGTGEVPADDDDE